MRDTQKWVAQDAIIESGCHIDDLGEADIEQLLRLAAHLAGPVGGKWEILTANQKLIWLKIAYNTVVRSFSVSESVDPIGVQQNQVFVLPTTIRS